VIGRVAAVVVLGLCYLGAACVGLAIASQHGVATLIWPASGVGLASLLRFGMWLTPGVAVGGLLAALVAGLPLPLALGIAAGATLEALFGVWIVRRVPDFDRNLGRTQDVLALVAAALGSGLLAATLGVGLLRVGDVVPHAEAAAAWQSTWLSHAVGDLVVAPSLLLGWRAPRIRRIREIVGVTVGLLAVFLLAFVQPGGLGEGIARPYMIFPVLIVAALRFGQCGVASALLATTVAAVIGVVTGNGLYVKDGGSPEDLLAVQTFLVIASTTFLFLGGAIGERRRALAALAETKGALEARVQERTRELMDALSDLRQREGQLAEAQRLSHIGSWEWDMATDRMSWSDEMFRLRGLTPSPGYVETEERFRNVVPEDRARILAARSAAVEGKSPYELEYRVVRPDGVVRTLHSRGRVILEEGRRRVVGTAQDVTVERQAEAALRTTHEELERRVRERTAELDDAVRARDAFISIASHELKTPISALQLHIGRLVRASRLGRRELLEPERVVPQLERIDRDVDRLAVQIDGLLDVSRITAGRLELELEDVDLAEIVRTCAGRFVDERAASRSELRVRLAGPIVGRWDRLRLEQIVSNLLSNAVKYGAGKPIDVEATATKDTATVRVHDRGIGIAPEDQARVFQRFERLVSPRQYGGFGLGLWIVRQIAQALGGTIHVQSELGEGSTFVVELPRHHM
jgi:signal transduction histidine kinase